MKLVFAIAFASAALSVVSSAPVPSLHRRSVSLDKRQTDPISASDSSAAVKAATPLQKRQFGGFGGGGGFGGFGGGGGGGGGQQDQQNQDQQNQDQQNQDQQNQDQQNQDQQNQDQQNQDQQNQDQQNQDQQNQDQQNQDQQNQDQQNQDQQNQDQQNQDQQNQDQQNQDQQNQDQQNQDQQNQDQQNQDQQNQDQQNQDQQNQDQQNQDQQNQDQQNQDQQNQDQQNQDQQNQDQQNQDDNNGQDNNGQDDNGQDNNGQQNQEEQNRQEMLDQFNNNQNAGEAADVQQNEDAANQDQADEQANNNADNGEEVEATGGVGGIDPATGEPLLALPEVSDFCQSSGVGAADGTQIQGGSCSSLPQGVIPSVDKMVSTIILEPENGQTIQAGEAFNVRIQTRNLQTGFFTEAQTEYYTQPQTLNDQGIIKGHQHITIQNLGGADQAPDANQKDFFKGLNDAANGNGELETEVPAGTLTQPGLYRICSMTGTFSHQPVVMPIAQRGSQDDCIRVQVE